MKQYLIIYLFILTALCKSSKTQPDKIQLLLTRKQISPWTTDNTQSANSICASPKKQKILYSENISLPLNCSKTTPVKIVQNCIFKNLAYNVDIYFGNQTKNNINYSLQVDLMSPWSWVKSPVCQTCSRDGETCNSDKCVTNEYNKLFSCNPPCKQIQRCGEIDLFAEGLSVVGQFVDSKNIKVKDVPQTIKSYKLLWAHAISGQNFLNADGALGLGQEYNESDQDDLSVNEQGASFLNQIVESYELIESKLFAIFIADSTNNIPQHIDIGKWSPDYIHNAKNNNLQWVNCIQNTEDEDDYFLWKVPIQSIYVKTVKNEKDIADNSIIERTIDLESTQAIFSLSTTALVLPKDELSQLISIFQTIYSISCKIETKYLYFVVCYNLSQTFEFTDISIVIKLGDNQVPLYVDPHYLVQNCKQKGSTNTSSSSQKKVSSTQYDCILNLQQSYNEKTILGESMLKNSYVVFDQDNQKIGIAAARNKYNEGLFYLIEETIEEIGEEIAYDIIFILRFCVVIFLLLLALCSFKYMNFIISFIEKICSRLSKKKSSSKVKMVGFQNIPSNDQTNNTNNSEIQTESIKEKIDEITKPQNLDDL